MPISANANPPILTKTSNRTAVCRARFRCLADFLESEASVAAYTAFKPASPNESVYFIGGETGPVKIGLTTSPEQRLESLQTGCPMPLRILAIVPGGRSLERAYHRFFESGHVHGEWFARCEIMESEIRYWSRKVRAHAPALPA